MVEDSQPNLLEAGGGGTSLVAAIRAASERLRH
jgi:hypothetical protein